MQQTMKRRLKRLGLASLLLPALVVLYPRLCSTYGFGIRESAYPRYFGPESHNINGVVKHDRERSWLTKLQVGNASVEVEHLTFATRDDQFRLKLPPGDYLFSSVDVRSPGVAVIGVTHVYRNEPLETVGTFIYRASPDPNGPWVISRLIDEPDILQAPYGYVKVYRAPSSAAVSNLLPEFLWFAAGMKETLRIQNDGVTHDFEFALEWHESSSIWWRLLTIT